MLGRARFQGVVGDPAGERVRGERAAQVVALGEVAAQRGEALERQLVLDALGDHLQPEVVAEVDRRAHDDQVALVLQHRRDERAVDLELVDRQALEVGKRRVAGAEVVDREAHAELGEAPDDRQRALGVGHDHALGDLQLKGVRQAVRRCRAASRSASAGRGPSGCGPTG